MAACRTSLEMECTHVFYKAANGDEAVYEYVYVYMSKVKYVVNDRTTCERLVVIYVAK